MSTDDPQEALRYWRLKCIRAEAEVRATSASIGSDEDAVALESLAEALALERHLEDVQAWRELALEEHTVLQTRCEESHAMSEEVTRRAAELSAEIDRLLPLAGDRILRQRRLRAEHEQRCRRLLEEASANISRDPLEQGPSNAAQTFQELQRNEQLALQSALRAREREETLLLALEDARMQRLDAAHAHSNNLRDISWAKKTIQLRANALAKVQSEALRGNYGIERAMKTLTAQLEQSRRDLADATLRAESVGDQLRKVKQKHGRQLKTLRTTTGGLQQEVDEHLSFLETSAEELAEMRRQESQLERERSRFVEQQNLLEEQALELKNEYLQLRRDADDQQLEFRNGSGRHFAEKSALLKEEVQARDARLENIRTLETSLREALAVGETLTAEMEQELSESHSQREQIEELRALQEQATEAQASEKAAQEEEEQLVASTRALKNASDRYNADAREVEKRFQRMRQAHSELAAALQQGTKSLGNGSLEQGLAKVSKRAEAFAAYLRPPARRGPTGPPKASKSAPCEQLQERILGGLTAEMEVALSTARKRVLSEQTAALQATRSQTDAYARARRVRCDLASELSRVENRCVWLQACSEHEQQAVLAQAAMLDVGTAEHAEALAMAAEEELNQQAEERRALLESLTSLRQRKEEQKQARAEQQQERERERERERRRGDGGSSKNNRNSDDSGNESNSDDGRNDDSGSSERERGERRGERGGGERGIGERGGGERGIGSSNSRSRSAAAAERERERRFEEELDDARAEHRALHQAFVPLRAALLLHDEGQPLQPFLPVEIDEGTAGWTEEVPQPPISEPTGLPDTSGSVSSLSTNGSAPVLQAPPLRPRRHGTSSGEALQNPTNHRSSHPARPPQMGDRLA